MLMRRCCCCEPRCTISISLLPTCLHSYSRHSCKLGPHPDLWFANAVCSSHLLPGHACAALAPGPGAGHDVIAWFSAWDVAMQATWQRCNTCMCPHTAGYRSWYWYWYWQPAVYMLASTSRAHLGPALGHRGRRPKQGKAHMLGCAHAGMAALLPYCNASEPCHLRGCFSWAAGAKELRAQCSAQELAGLSEWAPWYPAGLLPGTLPHWPAP